jgi:hypothetical protein
VGTTIARSNARNTPNFRIVEVAERATVAITGLTITGGKLISDASQGGGIANEGTITSLSNDSIRGNRAGFGGGVYNNGRISNLDNDTISGNSAGNGGGVANLGRITSFSNDTVSSNRAGIGGGISNGGAITSLRHSVISDNHLTANGAGGGIANAFGRLNMTGDRVVRNTATAGPQASGGGIDNSGRLMLARSVVSGNVARGVGGGLRNEEQAAPPFAFIVRSTTVINNTVTSSKGPATGGGIYNAGDMSLSSTVVRQNKASTQTGRAIGAGVYNGHSLSLSTTSIVANVVTDPGGAAEGGGLYVDDGSTKTALEASSLKGNRATGGQPHGGGIFFAGGTPVTLISSMVAANKPENCYPPNSVIGCPVG